MSAHFRTWTDPDGNLIVEQGLLIAQHSTTTWFPVGGAATVIREPVRDGYQQAAQAAAGFAGGSGRNLHADTAAPGGLVPLDWFVPTGPDTWAALGNEEVILTFDPGDGSAQIEDATDIIATLAPGVRTNPAGTFNSTAYGETFNGAAPWTLDLSYEGGPAWGARKAVVLFAGTTVPGGLYSRTGWQSWECDTDPSWTITLDGTGAGELSDGVDVVATRAADPDRIYDPTGQWVSTPAGAAGYGEQIETVAGVASAGDFPDQEYRLADITGPDSTWVGVDDATKFIIFESAFGDCYLHDETGEIGERTSTASTAHFDGTYTANSDGEDRYNGGAGWTYTVTTVTTGADFYGEVSLARGLPIEGVVYVEIARDAGTDVVSAVSGPIWGSAIPANTATEVYWPIAAIDSLGTAYQLQLGPIRWVPAP
jgi:hypothetical protein